MASQSNSVPKFHKLTVPIAEAGHIKEFRVVLPMDVDEYHCAQLFSIAEASKNETGGGEGIEVFKNEPFDEVNNAPWWPLLGGKYTTGQFTHKIYKLHSKVPKFVRLLAPAGSLEFHEIAWNAYPYCRTLVTNEYMKDSFYIIIESMHLPDSGETANPHMLQGKNLQKREIVNLDIGSTRDLKPEDIVPEEDPIKFKSTKTGRGPLTQGWQRKEKPLMCCYKLVSVYFKWFGLQNSTEKFILKQYPRMFTKFHRLLFCQTDLWYGLTMEEIRAYEEKTKEELALAIKSGEVKGTKVKDDK